MTQELCKLSHEELSTLAYQNDVDAQAELGYRLSNGIDADKDPVKAFFWSKQAAEHGSVRGMANVGNDYFFGSGVEENRQEAIKWYKFASKNGNRLGMTSLGRCYLYGEDIEKDPSKAFQLFESAAAKGHMLGQFELARMYLQNEDIQQNLQMACYWFKKAAEQGHEESATFLRNIMASGGVDTTKNYIYFVDNIDNVVRVNSQEELNDALSNCNLNCDIILEGPSFELTWSEDDSRLCMMNLIGSGANNTKVKLIGEARTESEFNYDTFEEYKVNKIVFLPTFNKLSNVTITSDYEVELQFFTGHDLLKCNNVLFDISKVTVKCIIDELATQFETDKEWLANIVCENYGFFRELVEA